MHFAAKVIKRLFISLIIIDTLEVVSRLILFWEECDADDVDLCWRHKLMRRIKFETLKSNFPFDCFDPMAFLIKLRFWVQVMWASKGSVSNNIPQFLSKINSIQQYRSFWKIAKTNVWPEVQMHIICYFLSLNEPNESNPVFKRSISVSSFIICNDAQVIRRFKLSLTTLEFYLFSL